MDTHTTLHRGVYNFDTLDTDIEEVTKKYRGHASLLVHLFPLPYHQYSFAASQVAASLYKSPSFFSKWVETVYLHQEEFYNDRTLHLSRSEVDQKLSQLGPESGLAAAVVLDALQTREYDMALRTSWKYGCSRGVTGTPIYIVNGVLTTPKANTIEAWADIIKPLLQ
ncbi:hypothetical protein SARC_09822 [Sphaeroforma arctica JP610]|uniref:Thioredoxin-like fold domain-containing protein n=1 Tax=Sphaeroforma arctica JP610 TaxID=667725 RepID=A0A0L0FMK1_9EUKA|nr:hypothetical protein SARC_09822 [Sphaeroforma arctica JP610]KNC77726.1 hypothetical protein SARC_09822 [Sphaeroforma arctica JP610]|eukprot:XP_014151628.1 hypothetical protein SARC_09822 [Sphaeroforma arctica JP610]